MSENTQETASCRQCGHLLEHDEIAVYRKLVNRGAREFLCISCLARHFNVEESLIREKIVQFKAMGCTLF